MDLIIVGNGLSIDLRDNYKETLREWDTSKPLLWNLNYPVGTNIPLLQSLPHLNSAINRAKSCLKKASDFDLINDATRQAEFSASSTINQFESGLLRTEIYIFLNLAYSNFDSVVTSIDTSQWKWQKFLKANKINIVGAISFNYDLVLERTLRKIGLDIYAFGVQESKNGILVGKPHGSIDYEVAQGAIVMPVQIPPTSAVYKNNTPLRRLCDYELQHPHIQCELVPPLEASVIRYFQWVAPVFDWVKRVSDKISRCIIIGLSYSEPDRKEINELLDSLNGQTEIIIASPRPSEELIKAVRLRTFKYKCWKDGPQVVNR